MNKIIINTFVVDTLTQSFLCHICESTNVLNTFADIFLWDEFFHSEFL